MISKITDLIGLTTRLLRVDAKCSVILFRKNTYVIFYYN